MDHSVTLIWPDASITTPALSQIHGLTREINGKRVRPETMLYEGDVKLIKNEAERLQLVHDLCMAGVWY